MNLRDTFKDHNWVNANLVTMVEENGAVEESVSTETLSLVFQNVQTDRGGNLAWDGFNTSQDFRAWIDQSIVPTLKEGDKFKIEGSVYKVVGIKLHKMGHIDPFFEMVLRMHQKAS